MFEGSPVSVRASLFGYLGVWRYLESRVRKSRTFFLFTDYGVIGVVIKYSK